MAEEAYPEIPLPNDPVDAQWVRELDNISFRDDIEERMGMPMERVMVVLNKYGNTTAATIPLCLWDYEQRLKPGDRLILAAFGGGFTWAGAYVTWGYKAAGG